MNKKLIKYEEELENKMKLELEQYKKELIEEYETDNDDENIDSNNLQKRKNNLESQIRIQKEKNNNKKEIEEQRKNNNLEENKKHLGQINKNKIYKLIDEFKFNFDKFVKEFENKNKSINNDIFSHNNYLNQEELSIKDMLSQYSEELESQLEFSKNSLKNEYDQKLQNELENLKNNILINTDDESKKYMEDKKEIESEYYSE